MFPWQAMFFKTLLLGGLAIGLLWAMAALRIVTVPILTGFFIAYALNPVVRRLKRWHVPSFFALSVPVLALVSLEAVFAVVIGPNLTTELVLASQKAPARLYNLMLGWDPWILQATGKTLTQLVPYDSLSGVAQSLAQQLIGPAKDWLGLLLSSARDLLRVVGSSLLVLVVAFFLLDDYERITRLLDDLVPPRRREDVHRIFGRIDDALGGFLRGQFLLLSLATLAFTVGLLALQVPYALVLGPLAGTIYLVPYLGVLTGGGICALLAAVSGVGAWQPLAVVVLFGAFYTVDLLYVTPRLIGHRVGLPPLAVLLGIIAFGELLGVVGILLAIPVLACARILMLEAIDSYRHSAAFLGEGEDGGTHAQAPAAPAREVVDDHGQQDS
jgi:predicted PurR-regulated permease PerM